MLNKSSYTVYFSQMKKGMFITISQFKIAFAVIGHNMIFMMDKFMGFKVSFKNFLHYKAVFKNISTRIFKRMVKTFYCPITIPHNSSTFPIRIFFTTHPKMSKFMQTIQRTGWVFIFSFSINNLFTIETFHSYHGCNDTTKEELCQVNIVM